MGDLRGGDPQKSDFWGEFGVAGGVIRLRSTGILRAAGALLCLAIYTHTHKPLEKHYEDRSYWMNMTPTNLVKGHD